MKRATALKIIGPLFLVGLLIGVSVSGQQEAKVESAKKVVQGSKIIFQITTDKPANVVGGVDLLAVSVEGGEPLGSAGRLDGRTATAELPVPLDAKPGKWKITKVTFRASGGVFKDLTPKGDLTFEVTPHDPIILPSQADVEIR